VTRKRNRLEELKKRLQSRAKSKSDDEPRPMSRAEGDRFKILERLGFDPRNPPDQAIIVEVVDDVLAEGEPGRPKAWSWQRKEQLRLDYSAVKKSRPKMSDLGICKILATQSPYRERYEGLKPTTIVRRLDPMWKKTLDLPAIDTSGTRSYFRWLGGEAHRFEFPWEDHDALVRAARLRRLLKELTVDGL
jgi:hypothetical protein